VQSLESGVEPLCEVISFVSDAFPPAELVVSIVTAFIQLEALLIKAVDIGNGAYLTVLWFPTGVVVPGSR
jgi:hypothetical protein